MSRRLLTSLLLVPTSLLADMWVSTPPRGIDQLNPLPKKSTGDPKKNTTPSWRLPEEVFQSWTENNPDKVPEVDDSFTVLNTVRPKHKSGFNYLLVQDFYRHNKGYHIFFTDTDILGNNVERDMIAALTYAMSNDNDMNRSIALDRLSHGLMLHGLAGPKAVSLLLESKANINPGLISRLALAFNLDENASTAIVRRFLIKWVLTSAPKALEKIHKSTDVAYLLETAIDADLPTPLRLQAAERLVTISADTARQWARTNLNNTDIPLRIQAVRIYRILEEAPDVKKLSKGFEPCVPELVTLAVELDDDDFTTQLKNKVFNRRKLLRDEYTYRYILSTLLGDTAAANKLNLIIDERLHLCAGSWVRRLQMFRNQLRFTKTEHSKTQQDYLNLANRAITHWSDINRLEGNNNVAGPVPLALIVKAQARSSRTRTQVTCMKALFPTAMMAMAAVDRKTIESFFAQKLTVAEGLSEAVPIELNELQAIYLESLNSAPDDKVLKECDRILRTPLEPRIKKAIAFLSKYKPPKKQPDLK